jgi:hypothetical protein
MPSSPPNPTNGSVGANQRTRDSCPKCGYRIPLGGLGTDECPACRIVMSRWAEVTDRHNAAREARRSSSPPRKSSKLSSLLPLLLLLGVGGWMWQQMQVPVPGSSSGPPPSVNPTASPVPAPEPDSQDTSRQPATSPATAAEPASSRYNTEVITTAGEETPRVGPTSEAKIKPEAEIPPGGESPLNWRPTTTSPDRPAELSDWHHNQDGYIRALRRRSHVKGAMVLYFRTDWCPWSRRFEDEFLADPAIADWASDKIRVVLDPEFSLEEAGLVRRLGITGFPAFFVIPPAGKPIPIRPYPEGEAVSLSTFLSQAKRASRP